MSESDSSGASGQGKPINGHDPSKQTRLISFTAEARSHLTDREWLEQQSKEDLVDLVVDLALDMAAMRSSATTSISKKGPTPRTFPAVPVGDVEMFRRLPALSSKALDDQVNTTWRLVLISFNREHPPLSLEIYDNVTIGREAPGVNIDLNLTDYDAEHYGVSREHALLRPTHDGLLLFDLGSSNGTFCNDHRASLGVPLSVNDGDVISFGALHFQVNVVKRPSQ
jgi:hypothetical protein